MVQFEYPVASKQEDEEEEGILSLISSIAEFLLFVGA